MRASPIARVCWLATLLACVAPARAQSPAPPSAAPPAAARAPAASPPEARPAASRDCGAQAGLYATPKGARLWVTRHGTMVQDNPLRPLSQDAVLVLQVVVNGRVATAYGPDFDTLLRGGPPAQLEAGNHPIQWEAALDNLPAAIRVVSEDGSVVLGPLAFGECTEPPKTAPPPSAGRPARTRAAAPKAGPAAPSGFALPQGALPQGALPQNALPQ